MTTPPSVYDPARRIIDRQLANAERNVRELLRRWIPSVVWGHVIGGSVVSAAAVWAGVTHRLPLIVVIGAGMLALSAVVALFGTLSLLRGERLRRALAEIRERRAQERILELEDALDLVELAARGDRQARHDLIGHRRARGAGTALRALESGAIEYGRQNPERSKPAKAAIRSGGSAAKFDVRPIKNRRARREEDLKVVRAEIQALAAMEDKGVQQQLQETREEARAARARAWEADRMIRERIRRGQLPLPKASGPQHEISMRIAPLHDNQVSSRVSPSPEMVANGETVEPS